MPADIEAHILANFPPNASLTIPEIQDRLGELMAYSIVKPALLRLVRRGALLRLPRGRFAKPGATNAGVLDGSDIAGWCLAALKSGRVRSARDLRHAYRGQFGRPLSYEAVIAALMRLAAAGDLKP
jgi:hypothetical protein